MNTVIENFNGSFVLEKVPFYDCFDTDIMESLEENAMFIR
jgi:hypothetical protein